MDFDDNPADAAFRATARAWLADHVGPYRIESTRSAESLVFADVSDVDHVVRGRQWQNMLYEGGYAGLGWPVEYGGRGLPISQRIVWAQEAAAAKAPPTINFIGEAMAGPTLIAHGTEEQKQRYLAPMLRGDEIWCQLFSEPSAGSDVAAVTTRAERDGDEWIVEGHKTWTSGAHYADFGILLARSDWEVPKHQGCTYFIVDMKAPGVSVVPLRQMTGGASFNEVFLDGVRVPDSQRIGAMGDGWSIALTTLMNERLSIGTAMGGLVGLGYDRLLSEVHQRGTGTATNPHVRQLAAQVYIESQCLRYLGYRAVSKLAAGQIPGPEGSVAKLALSRLARQADRLLDAMQGPATMIWDAHTDMQLWIPSVSIAGGTDEVLRNIIGERILGLPSDVRVDKEVPFRDVPVGTVRRSD
jgi:alkylation response protein AidB-like acyl-CoA dehydrogenase